MSIFSFLKNFVFYKKRLLTVLDIGSTKISCIIARVKKPSRNIREYINYIEILGFGVYKSLGIKSGSIINIHDAEKAIRLAVDGAEKMANIIIDSVIVNVSSQNMRSEYIIKEFPIVGSVVTEKEIQRVLFEESRKIFLQNRSIIHIIPVSFSLDGIKDIINPIDMIGDNLGIKLHIITIDTNFLRNLECCINRSHLMVETVVATSLANGLSVLFKDEAQIGAACIDFGGETTKISIFSKGKFIFSDSFNIGSHHITLDIARGFSISIEEAERLKIFHGSTFLETEKNQFVILPNLQEPHKSNKQYSKDLLSRIILARAEEILKLTKNKLISSGLNHAFENRVILTGGGVQLIGFLNVAKNILGNNLRIGYPFGISNLPGKPSSTSFSTIIGLLIYPQFYECSNQKIYFMSPEKESNIRKKFQLISQWLRNNFH